MADIKTKARLADPSRGTAIARKATKSTASAASAKEVDVNKPLTDKQKIFVKSWAEGNSIGRASLDAGFADDGIGYRLARMPNVLKLKAELSAKYEEAAQITRKSVMDMHLEAFAMAKLMSEPATMVSAARELGKMAGYYAPVEHRMKVDVSGNIVLNKLNALSDAELLEVITKGAKNADPQLLSDETPLGDPD